MWGRSKRAIRGAMLVVAAVGLSGVALAHGGSLRGAAADPVAAPRWLVVLTGGGVVGGSFLLATFVTDRRFVEDVHTWRRAFEVRGTTDALASVGRAVGVLGLGVVLVVGFVGPTNGLSNLAILTVWVGWWSGYAMTTYLVGNTWPILSPWRTLARWLSNSRWTPDGDRGERLARLGVWPAVVGLLGLIWIEVVSPLADDPRLLAWIVLGYTVVTLAGAVTFGPSSWFATVDPVSRVFDTFGRLAPVTRIDGRLTVHLPGSAPSEFESTRLPGDAAFVVALLWATTYDGFVTTPAWAGVVRFVVDRGVPPHVVYLAALGGGFLLFYGTFRVAARCSRRTAETYLTTNCIGRWFAPSLIPIAAGYHLAHFLGYFLTLLPALGGTLGNPLAPPPPQVLVLPAWFAGLELWFVLAGHLLAIWVAHTTAYRLFPGRLQAVRSQVPLAVAMVCYTVSSLWIVSQPIVAPPYL